MQRSNGGAAAACASCRHQRKKCNENCALAPYFPVEKNREFQAVHKFFGVSNVTKLVNSLNAEDRQKAVDSLVWEAFCRQKDPVLGCYGEFKRVLDELKWFKSQYQTYKSAQVQIQTGLINLGTGGLNNNTTYSSFVNNGNGNGNNLSGSYANYNYSSVQNNVEKLSEERDNGSVILPQQQVLNGFNQQYYQLPGICLCHTIVLDIYIWCMHACKSCYKEFIIFFTFI